MIDFTTGKITSRIRSSTIQDIPSGIDTVITYPTDISDDSIFTYSSGVFTATQSGVFIISSSYEANGTTGSGYIECRIEVNGSQVGSQRTVPDTNQAKIGVVSVLHIDSGDLIRIVCRHARSVNLPILDARVSIGSLV